MSLNLAVQDPEFAVTVSVASLLPGGRIRRSYVAGSCCGIRRANAGVKVGRKAGPEFSLDLVGQVLDDVPNISNVIPGNPTMYVVAKAGGIGEEEIAR